MRPGRNAVGVEAIASYIQAMTADAATASPIAAANATDRGHSVAEYTSDSATTQGTVYLDGPATPPPSTTDIV